MGNWIKELNDDNINKILENEYYEKKIPSDMNEKMLLELKKFPQRAQTEKKAFNTNAQKAYFKFAFAALFIIAVSISFLFFVFKNKIIMKNNINSSIVLTNNNVYISENGGIKKFKQGDNISQGQIIKTESNSECKVQISKRALVSINENTSVEFLKLKEGKPVKLNLTIGQISVKVDNKIKNNLFHVITKSAVISVIGTEFDVTVNENEEIRIDVKSGKVKVEPVFLINKNNYIILKKSESLILNNKKIIKKGKKDEFINNTKDINDHNSENDISEELSFKKIYTYINPDDKSENDILSFASSKSYIVTQTRTSLICFDENGNLKWERKYGKSKGILFMSVPIIYKDKIYISTINKKLLIIDLITGKEEKIIETQGNIAFGYQLKVFNNKLYLPYTNGLYIYDLNNSELSSKPFLSMKNPTIPLFKNDKIFLSSFVDKTIKGFKDNGENIWSVTLNSRSFCPPVLFNNYIVIGDDLGTIYKFSFDGKIINEAALPSGISSSIVKKNDIMYVTAYDGILYKINTENLIFQKLFMVDETPDVSDYLFKKPNIINNKLLIGTNNGEVIICNLNTNNIEKNYNVSNAKITTSVYNLGESLFVGNQDGEIYLLK